MIEDILGFVMHTLRRRPQNPRKRDYFIREVRIPTPDPTVTLAGEFTAPNETEPHPAVVLLTGSGQHKRDEPLVGHKWFLVLSDYLTRNGIAVLRCDDRGAGKSTGNFDAATLDDYAVDAAAAIDWLREQPGVNRHQCGLIGHSEGGMTASLAATLTEVDFIVMLAGAAERLLPDILARQMADIMRSQGTSETEIEIAVRRLHELARVLRETDDLEEARVELMTFAEQEGLSKREIKQNAAFWIRPWGQHHARYDPRPALAAYTGPVLALFGGTDLQVHAESHAALVKELVTNPHSKVEIVEHRNHLFQPSETGKLEEYMKSRTTIDEAVMQRVANWIHGLKD